MEEEEVNRNSNIVENGVDTNPSSEEVPEQEPEQEDAEGQEEDEEQEEQPVASFPEEDSMSRDSSSMHGLGGDESRDQNGEHENEADPIADKVDFMDEGQSLDAVSEVSEEQEVAKNPEENQDAQPDLAVEDSSDSKVSTGSKERSTESDQNPTQESDADLVSNLMADETVPEDDEEENVVAEVDISSMMEINFDEESENSQSQSIQGTANDDDDGAEPEVIPLDSDDETNGPRQAVEQNGSDDAQPYVIGVDEAIYEVDDHENITEVDVSSRLTQQVGIDENSSDSKNDADSSSSTPSRRPRRAAAEAAAKTIHQISAAEQGIVSNVFRTTRKSQEDTDFNMDEERSHETESPISKQKCFVCKKIAPCSIVIRQYGSDIYLCSNACFNKFRNQGNEAQKKTLPCSKCGIMQGDSNGDSIYYWETMNFCSDFCVGRYQIDIGSKCCTCGISVPWNSLGKYCVRFGSDIRQFCVPACLEGYKKKARVCFNCQLDIRRSGNVILANIPSNSSPKEFCSNDCVEMYCDRNMHQPTRAKPQPEHNCCMCGNRKTVHRELVLPNGSFKTCSEACWRDILSAKSIAKAEKCEMCAKFVNMDLGFTTPVYWISTMHKIYGFCSHVCKNLYILNNREIIPCASCKVKKYNFDLIEHFTNSESLFAVCSLACLPKDVDYLKNIRDVIYIPHPTSDKASPSIDSSPFPIISSVVSIQAEDRHRGRERRKQFNGGAKIIQSEVIELDDEDEDDIQIVDSDRILDILTPEELELFIQFLENRPKTRSVKCMAKPRTRTVETQTDVSELNDMERIPLVPDEVVHYVPVPIPTLVHVPFPGYFLESPCPVPFPIPVPIPIPIPVIIPSKTGSKSVSNKDTEDDDDDKDSRKGSRKDDDDTSKRKPTEAANGTITNTVRSTTNTTVSGHSNTTSELASERVTEREFSKESLQVQIKPESKTMSCCSLGVAENSSAANKTSSASTTPDVNRRSGPGLISGSGHNFPSPSYCQDGTYPTSIFPSPVSNYSPTYGSSPGPPLTPVAPIPPVAATHPMANHYTTPSRDYSLSTVNPMPTQVPGGYPTYDAPAPRPYIPPVAPPVIRPPVVVGSGYATHSSSTSMGYANAPHPSLPISTLVPPPPTPKSARVDNALRAWKMMFGPASDPRSISSVELSAKLCDLINRGCKPSGERYRADILLYISLGIQQLLRDNKRVDKIFYDNMYYNFVLAFTDRAERELTVGIHNKIEEIHFWETSELGATSPGVLLFTLIFMFCKHFGLKTWEMHAGLQFSNILVQSKYDQFGRYIKYMSVVGVPGIVSTEIPEDISVPDRCLIKLFEFYCFKSEIQSGPFYKCLRQDFTPRTPWFTSQQLDRRHIYQMLMRASMISNNDNFS